MFCLEPPQGETQTHQFLRVKESNVTHYAGMFVSYPRALGTFENLVHAARLDKLSVEQERQNIFHQRSWLTGGHESNVVPQETKFAFKEKHVQMEMHQSNSWWETDRLQAGNDTLCARCNMGEFVQHWGQHKIDLASEASKRRPGRVLDWSHNYLADRLVRLHCAL